MVYVDDGIITTKKNSSIDLIIKQLKERYEIMNKGEIQDYLGIHLEQRTDVTIKISQPRLIDQILTDVQLSPKSHRHYILAVSFRIIQ